MTDARSRLGRATSNTFKVLFGLAAVVAAGATYLAITDSSPGAAAQPGLLWLLIANLILIAGIATVLGLRVYRLVRENRETRRRPPSTQDYRSVLGGGGDPHRDRRRVSGPGDQP